MKYLIIITLFTCTLLSAQSDESIKEKANTILTELVDIHKARGVVAGISINNTEIWSSANGYIDFKKKVKANTEMRMRIASIAKPMTAVAIMQLYEKRLIELDKPIQYYIKEFTKNNKGIITVRQLLNHTSGIKAYASRKEAKSKKNYKTITDAMHVFMERETIGVPGKSYNYTTYGYVVLGVLIERVSGKTFEEYMKQNIWEKSGMTQTGVEVYKEKHSNKSQLFHKNKKGKVKNIKSINNLSNRIPGGGFYATKGDILKFGQAILNNTLIRAETLELMLKNNGIKEEGNPYGFGWFLYGEKSNQAKVFGHSGGQVGASTQLLIIPSSKTVIVVLANTSGVWGEVIGAAIQLHKIFKKEKK